MLAKNTMFFAVFVSFAPFAICRDHGCSVTVKTDG